MLSIYAKIYDFDQEYLAEDRSYIVRKVEKIEFANKHHNNDIIWYSGGLKSESFKFITADDGQQESLF